jgi:cytochrome c oxidase subunit II
MVDRLHYFVIGCTIGGAFLVTIIGGILIIRYRRTGSTEPPRADVNAQPPLWLERGAAASLFILFLVFWMVGVRQFSVLRVAPPGARPIYVTAKQWMWKFSYPEGAKSLSTLYVPVGQPVELIMTSRDVIHSFYVAEFRVKQDVLPGRYTSLWFEVTQPGRYEILCAEYCGNSHSMMRGEVIALEPADFARWLSGAPASGAVAPPVYDPPEIAAGNDPREPLSMVRQGEIAAAAHGCLRCHTTDGTEHIGPTWAGMYRSSVPLEDKSYVIADEAYITESMMDPMVKVHRGFRPVMPSYLGLIEPPDTAAIIEFIKSLRDVTPVPGSGGSPAPPDPTARPEGNAEQGTGIPPYPAAKPRPQEGKEERP